MNSCREISDKLSCVVLIPSYNNAITLLNVIEQTLEYCNNIIVVNDGSTDSTQQILENKQKEINNTTANNKVRQKLEIISYTKNRGKGHALKLGIEWAIINNFSYLISIDSDGQHYPKEIKLFLEQIQQTPHSLIIGARNLNAENMPSKNTFANKFSNFWYKVETGQTLVDTQSGFRLYPLEQLKGMKFLSPRYEFEVEVIVKAAWRGINVINIPIKVYYPPAEERISHFKPLRDFTRISILNSVLVLIALFYYYPLVFFRSLTIKNIKEFIDLQIIHSKETNTKISLSIALGIFCGIIPIWGYQMIVAALLAYLLKLNKVISLIASNISIPPMIPLILYLSLYTGGKILNLPTFIPLGEINLQSISGSLLQYIVGSVLLAIISGCTLGLLSFIILSIFRKR